jgi:hypothetical protein
MKKTSEMQQFFDPRIRLAVTYTDVSSRCCRDTLEPTAPFPQIVFSSVYITQKSQEGRSRYIFKPSLRSPEMTSANALPLSPLRQPS